MRPDEIDICFKIAQAFHEACERLAPNYIDWVRDSLEPVPVLWDELPEQKQLLLVGVIGELLDKKIIRAP